MRKTPVIVFINKLDRPGNDPFDLHDEVKKSWVLELDHLVGPLAGATFKGVYNLFEQKLFCFP
jgi:peptide chain release factor 3